MIKLLKVIGLVIIFVCLLLAMIGIIVFNSDMPNRQYYDCSMAEFHPDYPQQVKEECRRLRSAKII